VNAMAIKLPTIPVEKLTQPITVIADSIVWLGVVGNLQLALRHPANVGSSVPLMRDFAKQLLLKLVVEGVLTQDEAEHAFRDFR
jgi:hypothetical protein